MAKYTFGEKFRAILATGRMANLPTVWSNVLVGLGIVVLSHRCDSTFYDIEIINPVFSIALLLSASFLYVGGCMLGDYRDLEFDRQHRPNRPLPLGVLKPSSIAILSYLLLFLGLSLPVLESPIGIVIASATYYGAIHIIPIFKSLQNSINPVQSGATFLLTFLIIVYAFTHKKTKKYALLNMALCRFFLVVFACSSLSLVTHTMFGGYYKPHAHLLILIAILFATSVAIYTFLLSSVASTESTPEHYSRRKTLALIWFILPLMSIPFSLLCMKLSHVDLGNDLYQVTAPPFVLLLLAITVYFAWGMYTFKALKISKPTFVSRALAGFCLLDMCFAATFSPILALICLALFCLALMLQKIAPAT